MWSFEEIGLVLLGFFFFLEKKLMRNNLGGDGTKSGLPCRKIVLFWRPKKSLKMHLRAI